MKYFVFITIWLFCFGSLEGQENKTETVIAFGAGQNESDALFNAKLNALDQIFGTFISTSNIIINDSIVMNKIISVTNGQITNYEIIKTEQTDKGFITTIKVNTNIQNLISFCNSIGVDARIQGSLYADNLLAKMNNKENEIKVLNNFASTFKQEIPSIFDYSIKAAEPLKASNAENFLITVTNVLTINKNFNSIINILIDLIDQISIREKELPEYKINNLEYLPIIIESNERFCYRFLRSKESQKIILNFVKEIDAYLQNHAIVRNDMKEFRPYSRVGSDLNFLFYLDGQNWTSYKFFNSEFQPLSIGKLSYKCNPGDEKYLTDAIIKKYTFSGCFNINDSALTSQKFDFENKVNIETPFFIISSKCAMNSNLKLIFTYRDWPTIDEMKKIESYSIKKSY